MPRVWLAAFQEHAIIKRSSFGRGAHSGAWGLTQRKRRYPMGRLPSAHWVRRGNLGPKWPLVCSGFGAISAQSASKAACFHIQTMQSWGDFWGALEKSPRETVFVARGLCEMGAVLWCAGGGFSGRFAGLCAAGGVPAAAQGFVQRNAVEHDGQLRLNAGLLQCKKRTACVEHV